MLIPKENEKDLAEIPDNVKKGLIIVPVSSVDELLKHALVTPLVAIEWSEPRGSAGCGAGARGRGRPARLDALNERFRGDAVIRKDDGVFFSCD